MASSSNGSEKKITLRSIDGEVFEVEEAVAVQFQIIKPSIVAVENDNIADKVFSLPNVRGEILSKVIDYCKRHAHSSSHEDLKAFDSDFVKVDQDTLFDLILAAYYLEIKSLKNLTCQTVADGFLGMTPEDIRKTFKLNI